MLRAYYDGSRSHDNAVLTLAGLAASEAFWPDFEARWCDVLGQHGLKWWHSTDAMSLRSDSFLQVAAQGWDHRRAQAAFEDLAELVTNFWKAELVKDLRAQKGPQILTCTVDLDGYGAARRRNPWLRSVEAICVNVCVGGLDIQRDDDVPMALYFDQGEGFMKEIEQVWRKDRKKPRLIWPRQVGTMATLDWKQSHALQAADLLAWSANRECRTPGQGDPGASSFRWLNRVHAFYGQAEIEAEYPPEREHERLRRQQRSGRQTVLPPDPVPVPRGGGKSELLP